MIRGMFIASISLSFVLCAMNSNADEVSKFPTVELSNGLIKVNIYLPDAEKGYYRGTRFDWSGIISQVEYKGHTYFGEWKNTHNPNNHDDITGPVEEFRTGDFNEPNALGYKEAKPGEPFIKIGIGLLEKIDEPNYKFWQSYKIIKPGSWEVKYGKDWIEFKQDFEGINGWSYSYIKRITLAKDKPEFVIYHSLKNTGTRPIETSQYNHNFFIIDNTPIGTNYVLKFPFNVKIMRDLKGSLDVNDKEVYFVKDLGDESLFSEFEGFSDDPKDYDITVLNKKTGAGVRIKGDNPIVHLNFWTVKTTICPEPFVSANLSPNEKKDWNITYSFFTNP